MIISFNYIYIDIFDGIDVVLFFSWIFFKKNIYLTNQSSKSMGIVWAEDKYFKEGGEAEENGSTNEDAERKD